MIRVPLTVAIPTYNRASSLPTLLAAIVRQSCPGDDLLVVDDGSSDNTPAVVATEPRFRLVRRNVNQGMVNCWNLCLDEARCEWICVIHDDDELAPNGLDTLRKACAAAPGPSLIAHVYGGLAENAGFRYTLSEPGSWSVLNCPPEPSGVVLHRSIVTASGKFDPLLKYSADLEYFPRVCTRFPLMVIENPDIVRRRMHSGNYQFRTWRQPDFFDQIEAIERLRLGYAGIKGEVGNVMFESKMDVIYRYMFDEAVRRRNKSLVSFLGTKFRSRRSFSRSYRLRLWRGSLIGQV